MIATTYSYRSLSIGILVGVTSVYLLAGSIAEYRTQATVDRVDSALSAYETKIKESVLAIHANTTSVSDFTLHHDCSLSERAAFEATLSRLEEGLSKNQLDSLSELFSRCASVTVDKRSYATLQLEAKIDGYRSLIEAREIVTTKTENSNLHKYTELLAAEKNINQKLFELVDLQAVIIYELRNGLSLKSTKADELRQRGGQIQSEIKIQTEIANLLRKELSIE